MKKKQKKWPSDEKKNKNKKNKIRLKKAQLCSRTLRKILLLIVVLLLIVSSTMIKVQFGFAFAFDGTRDRPQSPTHARQGLSC